MEHLVKFVATGCYSGLLRPFAGTWGTIPAWAIAFYLIQGNQVALVAGAVLLFFISVWAAGEAEEYYGHDARKIVIDEWAGMFVTLLFVAFSFTNYLIAFIMFRLFDVIKITPANQAEKLPAGWGITMDDIVAGLQANIATQFIIYLLNTYYY